MQISNNNPTNTHTPHTRETRAKEDQKAQPHEEADPSGPNSVLNHAPSQRQAAQPQPHPRNRDFPITGTAPEGTGSW